MLIGLQEADPATGVTPALTEAAEDLAVTLPTWGETGFGLAVLVAGLLLWAYVAPLLERRLLGPERLTRPAAPWWALEMFTVAFATFSGILGSMLLLGMVGGSPLDPLLATDLGMLVGVVTAWNLARRRASDATSRLLGFDSPHGLGRELTYGLLGLLLGTPAILGVMQIAPRLLSLMGHDPQTQAVLAGILALDGGALLGAIVLASFVGPVLEEVLFRGFVQPACVDRLGTSGGILFTALLFAAIHGADAMLPVFALAVVLGILRHRTGGLAAPVLAHCLWNGTTLLVALKLVPA